MTKYFEPLRARSTVRVRPGEHHVGRGQRVGARQVEVAGDVVAGPGRDDAQGGPGAGEGLHADVHHAVPAADDQGVHAVGHALVGQVERLVGVPPGQVADHEPAVPQPA